MQIVVITGSPHKNGSSNLLAERFMQGAIEAGHSVGRFDAAFMSIHPCLGCDRYGMDGPCVQKDDVRQIRDALLKADMVVFATPIYYFNISAQLKMVIDRFYSYTTKLSGRHLKSALLTAAWDSNEDVMPCTANYYQKLCHYMNFRDQGMVLGLGCGTRSMTERTGYPEQAYLLGKSL